MLTFRYRVFRNTIMAKTPSFSPLLNKLMTKYGSSGSPSCFLLFIREITGAFIIAIRSRPITNDNDKDLAGRNGEIWTTLGRWKEVSFVLGFLPVPSKHTNSKQVSALSTGGLRYVGFLQAQTIKTTTRNHYAYFKEWSQTLLCELVYKIHVSTISGAGGGGGGGVTWV